ncbi:MAG: hypothetical protein ACYS8W_20845 [Planctomycetota bacterium]|jgi:hypothetical protein
MQQLRRSLPLIILAGLLVFAIGCHPHIYRDRPNPFDDVKVFAIAPILGVKEQQIPVSSEKLEDVFADELVQFPEIGNVVRVSAVSRVMENLGLLQLSSADDALKVLREVKADALIAMEVTNVNLMPHDMRVTVALQMFTVRKFDPRSIDWKRWDIHPRPFALPKEFGRRPIVGFQKSYVTSNKDTRAAIMEYAAAHDTSKRGLGDEVYTKIFREFFRFVSYDMILEIWQRELDRLERLRELEEPLEGEPE